MVIEHVIKLEISTKWDRVHGMVAIFANNRSDRQTYFHIRI